MSKRICIPMVEAPIGPDTVEHRILPLVNALAAVPGVTTVASCEGHVMPGKAPYVYFRAPELVASQLHKAIEALRVRRKLRFYWELHGCFDLEARLTYRLDAHDLSAASRSYDLVGLRRMVYYVFLRSRIDADLALLASTIQNLNDPSPDRSNDRMVRDSDNREDSDKNNDTAYAGQSLPESPSLKGVTRTARRAKLRIMCQRCVAFHTRLQHPSIPLRFVRWPYIECGTIRPPMQARGVS